MSDIVQLFKRDGIIASKTPRVLTFDLHLYITLVKDRQLVPPSWINNVLLCNRVYCIHVSGHDPLIFSFLSFIVFDWVGVLWPQLSKVLKPVR